MESKKSMMLSLLNLYLTYVDVKNGGKKTEISSRYITKEHQHNRTLTKDSKTRNTILAAATITERNDVVHTTKSITEQNEVSQTGNKILASSTKSITEQNEVSQTGNKILAATSKTIIAQNEVVQTVQLENTQTNNKRTVQKANKGRRKKNDDPNRKPRVRRWAIRPINRDRAITGYHRKVFANIKKLSQEQFFVHTRMSKPMFDWLLSFTKSSLNKKRQRVLAEERLAITLNYLAYGTPLQSIAFKHKLGKSTIREVVLSTCSVLWSLLSPIYLSEPTTSQYADIADDFKSKYEIPNCVGLIDGKHVSIRYRVTEKTTTYNKSNLSMILLGVCDAKYKFMAVSVENFDKKNENAIFQLSPFWNALISDNLPLPISKPLFPSSSPFPHYFIANTSLPLRKNIMRPYMGTDLSTAKTIFNYNISRAGSVIENSFGLLTARWRVLLTTIEFLPESCKTIILACVVLHNYVMANDDDQLYCPTNFIDREGEVGNIILGEWRSELKDNGDQPLPSMATNMGKSCYEANNLRDTLANYFSNESIFYDVEL